MIPVLYNSAGKCLGALPDSTRCYVTQERNGVYEAEIDIPMDSDMFGEVKEGAYILAKPDDISQPQKFKIYKPVKPLYGIVTFHCEHLRYALGGVPVSRGRYTGNPAVVFNSMITSVNSTSDFTFWSDISSVYNVDVPVPTTAGKMLAGQSGSMLDLFGGEYEFDNYTVKLYNRRGQDRSTEIRYAKNLTGFTCEADTSSTYTHVYPFYYNEMENVYVELAQKTIQLSGASSLPFTKCYMLDLTDKFSEPPTEAQLLSKAQSFINSNSLDRIKYSYRVSFILLWQTEEYKDIAALERCGLCDTVSVIHKTGEKIRAKIVKTVYDSIAERYVSMELGNALNTFAQTVDQTVNQINDNVKSTRSFLQVAVARATAAITGNNGGYVVLYDSNGDGEPDEILIMDTPSILTATKVWRWNAGGLGYSSHGYAGPYSTAITMNGEIVADFITTGTLTANVIRSGVLLADLIKAGVISDTTGNITINMTNGELSMKVDSNKAIKLNTSGLRLLDANSNEVAYMKFRNDYEGNLKGSLGADYFKGKTAAVKNLRMLKSDDSLSNGTFYVDSNGKARFSTDYLSVNEKITSAKIGSADIHTIILKDENDNTVGYFRVNGQNKAELKTDSLTAQGIASIGNGLTIHTASGNTTALNIYGDQQTNGNTLITGDAEIRGNLEAEYVMKNDSDQVIGSIKKVTRQVLNLDIEECHITCDKITCDKCIADTVQTDAIVMGYNTYVPTQVTINGSPTYILAKQ